MLSRAGTGKSGKPRPGHALRAAGSAVKAIRACLRLGAIVLTLHALTFHAALADEPTVTLPDPAATTLQGKWSGDFDGIGSVDLYLATDQKGKSKAIVASKDNKPLAFLGGTISAAGEMTLKVYLTRAAFGTRPLPDKAWEGALSAKAEAAFKDYLPTSIKLKYDSTKGVLTGPYIPLDVLYDIPTGAYSSADPMAAVTVELKRKSYTEECKDKGVPLPPDWGGGGWTKVGALPPELNFDGADKPDTEIWIHDYGADGICYALPRKSGGGIVLLGIICQGKQTGNACFWDNISRADGSPIVGASTAGMKAADMQGGDVLSENCTKCHRGVNAFLITRGTPLDLTPADLYSPRKTDPAKSSYKPIGQPSWVNPIRNDELGTDGFGKSGCGECHALPALTSNYCSLLTSTIAKKIMPPAEWITNNPDQTRITADIDQLKTECATAPTLPGQD
jgi:hypothetical protein